MWQSLIGEHTSPFIKVFFVFTGPRHILGHKKGLVHLSLFRKMYFTPYKLLVHVLYNSKKSVTCKVVLRPRVTSITCWFLGYNMFSLKSYKMILLLKLLPSSKISPFCRCTLWFSNVSVGTQAWNMSTCFFFFFFC